MLARWDKQFGREAAEKIARAALEQPETNINPETARQQDIGAQTIVPLLGIEPGMTMLDLCAAPGNKTAQAIQAGARTVACDRYWNRLKDVPDAAERVVPDATQPLPFPEIDRILIDAPCSGTGTLGRNPEIGWRSSPAMQHFLRSSEIALDQAAVHETRRPIVYSTCSLKMRGIRTWCSPSGCVRKSPAPAGTRPRRWLFRRRDNISVSASMVEILLSILAADFARPADDRSPYAPDAGCCTST
jgi:hypothetical protein